jgi:nucleolar protein 15
LGKSTSFTSDVLLAQKQKLTFSIRRIPHGFHEHEMRSYFSQFGEVNHVRLSRSKKNGRSKHYAFLEFKSPEVAKIAATTMNNYLLFGHILKCSVVPNEQVHPDLWKGADKRFKTVPWAKIEGRKLALPKGRSEWQKKIELEEKRRSNKANKLKELGYEFEAPSLTDVKTVVTTEENTIEAPTVQETTVVVAQASEDGVVVGEEIVTTKKSKKTKVSKKTSETLPTEEGLDAEGEVEKQAKIPSKRAIEPIENVPRKKKSRKAKSS